MGLVVLFCMRSFAYFFASLPRAGQWYLGVALGWVLRRFGFRSKIVRQNLTYAFEGDAQRVEQLFKESYAHFGNLILEIFLVLGPWRQFILKSSDLMGVEHWNRAAARGKGVLFLSSHVGNWEIMAATGSLYGKMDPILVTKRVKPEWLHRAIEKGRMTCGVGAAYEPKTARDILAHLKKGRTVGLVLDQYAGAPIGVRVPLFGRPVGTPLTLALFAKRTGAVVLPVVNYRNPCGRWTVEIQKPIEWQSHPDAHYELALNTSRYVEVLESHIRMYPEQWLWVHRRFKGDLGPLREGEWAAPRARR